MNLLRKQRGLSALSWLIIVSMAMVIFMSGLKLFPVYYEYYNVVSVLETMQAEPDLKGVTKNVIADTFKKRLAMNDVRSLKKENYKITKVKGSRGYKIKVNYEVKTALFGNLSIIAAFDRSAEVGG